MLSFRGTRTGGGLCLTGTSCSITRRSAERRTAPDSRTCRGQPAAGKDQEPDGHGKLKMNHLSALVAEKINCILDCTLQSISSKMKEMIFSFSIGEAIPGVLGPVLPPVQERPGHTAWSFTEGHQDATGAEAALRSGEVERAGTTQPGEEARRISSLSTDP